MSLYAQQQSGHTVNRSVVRRHTFDWNTHPFNDEGYQVPTHVSNLIMTRVESCVYTLLLLVNTLCHDHLS